MNSSVDISLLLRKTSSYQHIKEKISLTKNKMKAKPRKPGSIGDTTTFFVRDLFSLEKWNSISAECVYLNQNLAIWVSNNDLSYYADSLNLQEVVDSLSIRLLDTSNPTSINPSKGIIDLNTEYFV